MAPWRDGWLAALAESGSIADACRTTRVGRSTVYNLRRRDPEFAAEITALVRGDWMAAWLSALARTGNVAVACTVANVSRSGAYDRRRADPGFARAWGEAAARARPRERRPRERAPNFRHGHCIPGEQSPTWRSWRSMRERCLNRANRSYHRYGGRGITICQRWLDSFENFLADMGERPTGMTIDRINPDGDYEPRNCRWATASQQRRNQSKA